MGGIAETAGCRVLEAPLEVPVLAAVGAHGAEEAVVVIVGAIGGRVSARCGAIVVAVVRSSGDCAPGK